mgnify:CR=1 FL=1
MNVAFAAGGTGGHINPALAIADKLKEVFPDTNILFIGSPDGLEAKLVKKAGYDFLALTDHWVQSENGYMSGVTMLSGCETVMMCIINSALESVLKRYLTIFRPTLLSERADMSRVRC